MSETEAQQQDMLTYAEAAPLLGVTRGTLYSMVKRREVPHVRLGRRLVRFSRKALTSWLQAREVLPDDPASAPAAAREPQ